MVSAVYCALRLCADGHVSSDTTSSLPAGGHDFAERPSHLIVLLSQAWLSLVICYWLLHKNNQLSYRILLLALALPRPIQSWATLPLGRSVVSLGSGIVAQCSASYRDGGDVLSHAVWNQDYFVQVHHDV
jgi:hypothetical protein